MLKDRDSRQSQLDTRLALRGQSTKLRADAAQIYIKTGVIEEKLLENADKIKELAKKMQ